MTLTAENVRVGVTGAVYVAPLGTALPASLTAATTSFTDLGYVDEDGVTRNEPVDTNEIKAWQNGSIVRRPQTSHELTFEFTLLETSAAVQDLVFGGHAGAATPYSTTGAPLDHHAFVIDVVDGTKKIRYCIPDGDLTERPEVVYSNGEATKYKVTLSCYADSSGKKDYKYEGTTA